MENIDEIAKNYEIKIMEYRNMSRRLTVKEARLLNDLIVEYPLQSDKLRVNLRVQETLATGYEVMELKAQMIEYTIKNREKKEETNGEETKS